MKESAIFPKRLEYTIPISKGGPNLKQTKPWPEGPGNAPKFF